MEIYGVFRPDDGRRFLLVVLGPDHGIRKIKDQMTREIIAGFEKAKILVAATRQEGVALEPKPRRAAKR